MTQRRCLLTIAQCVALNRCLGHVMVRTGREQWEVTAVAPRFFHGDLRPISLEPQLGELGAPNSRLLDTIAHARDANALVFDKAADGAYFVPPSQACARRTLYSWPVV